MIQSNLSGLRKAISNPHGIIYDEPDRSPRSGLQAFTGDLRDFYCGFKFAFFTPQTKMETQNNSSDLRPTLCLPMTNEQLRICMLCDFRQGIKVAESSEEWKKFLGSDV